MSADSARAASLFCRSSTSAICLSALASAGVATLCQLTCSADGAGNREKAKKVVVQTGLEPVTFALLARRSNQLSYKTV